MTKKILPILLVAIMVCGAVSSFASSVEPTTPIITEPTHAIFTKKESVSELTTGEKETFTIVVKNPNDIGSGHNGYTSVSLSDVVPDGLLVTGVSNGASFSGNTVTETIGNIAPGESRTITIETIAVKTGVYINTANLKYTISEETSAWNEKVLVKEAYDETVMLSPAYDENLLVTPAWDEKVLDTPAWDETISGKPAWDEKIVDKEAWDETIIDKEAWDETIHHDELSHMVHHDAIIKHHDAIPAYDEKTGLDHITGFSSKNTKEDAYDRIIEWGNDHWGVGNYLGPDDIHDVGQPYNGHYIIYQTTHHDEVPAWDETVKEAWDEKIIDTPAWDETVHHPAETHIVHHEEISHIVHHDAIPPTIIHHDAIYKTVHHDAVYITIHHDAVYQTLHHDAEYKIVCHDATYHDKEITATAPSDPAIIDAIPAGAVNQVTPTAEKVTFTSVIKEPTTNAQEETVGMQETGAPLVALLLAGLMLFGGMLLPKRKL